MDVCQKLSNKSVISFTQILFIKPVLKLSRRTVYILFIIIIGGIIVLYIYIYKTILASNEIFSPSNKVHQEVGRARDLSAPR